MTASQFQGCSNSWSWQPLKHKANSAKTKQGETGQRRFCVLAHSRPAAYNNRMPFNLPKLSRRAITGIVFIYLAGLGWAAEFVIPFLNIPHKAIIFTSVLILAELSFVIGVALLGRAYYKQLKGTLIKFIRTGKVKPPANPS
ncbi:MAG: hypothetical protein JWN01_753 [Patescibacteria group bacterium]|nr:hypothetical protein [Patescibacteria group bacterium]